jgi:hypothetical protein
MLSDERVGVITEARFQRIHFDREDILHFVRTFIQPSKR